MSLKRKLRHIQRAVTGQAVVQQQQQHSVIVLELLVLDTVHTDA